MSDFLSHLIARTTDSHWGIQPRLPSRFELEAASETVQVSPSFPKTVEEGEEVAAVPSTPTLALSLETSGHARAAVEEENRASALPRPSVDADSMVQEIRPLPITSSPSASHTTDMPTSARPQSLSPVGPQPSRSDSDSLAEDLGHEVTPVPPSPANSSATFQASPPNAISPRTGITPLMSDQVREEQEQTLVDRETQPFPQAERRVGQTQPLLARPTAPRPTLKASDSTETASPQVIRITIGRIDVRPNRVSTAPASKTTSPSHQRLSLEDYLKQSPGGRL